jgi:preprotein translocase subunit SecA
LFRFGRRSLLFKELEGLKWDKLFNNSFPIGEAPSTTSNQPVQRGRKIGRNEKVDVEYSDGTIKKGIKYKKVEKDIHDGKCELI